MNDDREKERPSWREIDKKKDQSKHVRNDDIYKTKKNKRGSNPLEYKAALDSYFSGGKLPEKYQNAIKVKVEKGGSERQLLMTKIIEASTPGEVEKLTKDFLEKWEIPDDIEFLSSLLRHRDEEIIKQVLVKLEKIVAGKIIKRKAILENRLRQIEELSEEAEIKQMAAKIKKLIPKI